MTTFRSANGKQHPALAGLFLALVLWHPALPGVAQAQGSNGFDSTKAFEHLRQQVAIGPRPSGSAANVKNRDYIKAQMAALGITTTEQPFEGRTPLGPVTMVNIIATIPGKSADRIVLASHFDTKLFRDMRFVGASDGASSTAALIELGRVIKARGAPPFTIELLFLDGEEAVVEWSGDDNTYGSRYYVEAARKSGSLKSLRALILLDMIGDRNLTIRRESNSTRWLTEIVWGAAKKLGHRAFMDEETTVEDDHIPFLKAGVPSLDIIDLDYPQWHTAQDTLDAVGARSLQVVGETVMAALPEIEARLLKN
ncbi:MAG: M28 family peptidase [Cyanobacteria bacterium]|nr:M28 family peptidase [Cyanobacteriota bacterium]